MERWRTGREALDRLGQCRLRQTYTQSGEMENREGGGREASKSDRPRFHTQTQGTEMGAGEQPLAPVVQPANPHTHLKEL